VGNSWLRGLTALGIIACGTIGTPVHAVSPAQAETAIQAFNKTFWNPSTKLFYKRDGASGVLDFWLSAHTWETVMDAYQLTGKAEYKQQIADVYDGFVKRNGTDWTQNDYNDDIMWWTIACARAYEITGEERYKNQSKIHFDWVWKTQRDTVQGGVWWKNNEHKSKNSCVVQPAIITAIYLARILKDDGYRVKAESLFAWQKRTLTDPKNPGRVYDAISSTGSLGTGSTTYNQGTFIGSAVGLGHMADAKACADWTRKNMCNSAGVLTEKSQGDFAAFKLILVRYAIGFARKGGGAEYETWMEANAASVWEKRRLADNVMGFDWNSSAPATGIETASAASGVTLLTLLAMPSASIIRVQAATAGDGKRGFVFPGSAPAGVRGSAAPAVPYLGGYFGADGRLQAGSACARISCTNSMP
jgi:predicted alpha-1,6-mannanase (GH76 family)